MRWTSPASWAASRANATWPSTATGPRRIDRAFAEPTPGVARPRLRYLIDFGIAAEASSGRRPRRHRGRSASRRILGTVNDHARLIDHAIVAGGGLARCDLDTLHHSLHRTINSVTGYVPPIELVTATR